MRIAGSTLLVAIMLLVTSGAALAQAPSASEQFLAQAIQASMVEVELGKLAQKNAQSTGVNALGVRLQRDHARIAKFLKSVSRDKGLVVPALDTSQSAQIEALSAKTGADFDAAYVEAMVSNHEKAIALYTAVADGEDRDLSRLAKLALPTLREDQRLAGSYEKLNPTYDLQAAAIR
jgi:putative membrane protein